MNAKYNVKQNLRERNIRHKSAHHYQYLWWKIQADKACSADDAGIENGTPTAQYRKPDKYYDDPGRLVLKGTE